MSKSLKRTKAPVFGGGLVKNIKRVLTNNGFSSTAAWAVSQALSGQPSYPNKKFDLFVPSTPKKVGGKTVIGTKTTPSGRRYTLSMRQGGVSYGRFRGFTRRTRRMGRTYRRRYRTSFTGVQFNEEQVGTVTDNKVVYLTHHTSPISTLFKYAVYALFKQLLQKGGYNFASWQEQSAALFPAAGVGAQNIVYRIKPNPAAATVAYTYFIPTAVGTTFGDIADGLQLDMLNNFYTLGNYSTRSRMIDMELDVAGAGFAVPVQSVKLNLSDAKFSFIIKSLVKFQNRSVAVLADNEAQDVNNVPLHGKKYSFTGNTMILRGSVTNNMQIPNRFDGFAMFGAGTDQILQEPPEPYVFESKPKYAKVSVQPGDIKTDVLNYKKVMDMSRFFRFCREQDITGTTGYNPMGKSNCIALERVIGLLPLEATPAIIVSWESEKKYYIGCHIKNTNYTVPINTTV